MYSLRDRTEWHRKSVYRNIAAYRRTVVRLYVSVQQKLDVERFRTELTLELFGMTGQMLFHVGLRVERSVTHQASQHLGRWMGRKQSKTRYGRYVGMKVAGVYSPD